MKHTFRLLVLVLTTLTISRLGLAAGCAGTWTQTGEDYGGTQQCINYPGGSFIKRVFYTITFGNGHPENTYTGDSGVNRWWDSNFLFPKWSLLPTLLSIFRNTVL